MCDEIDDDQPLTHLQISDLLYHQMVELVVPMRRDHSDGLVDQVAEEQRYAQKVEQSERSGDVLNERTSKRKHQHT